MSVAATPERCLTCNGTSMADGGECLECIDGRVASGFISFAKIEMVTALCELAGLKEHAGAFLSQGLTVPQVQEQLIGLRAQESARTIINGHTALTGNSGNSMTALEAQAASYARNNPGVTKEKAFAQLLNANPHIYAQYKESKAADFSAGVI